MQNKKKLVVVAIASIAIGMLMLVAGQAQASSDWKDYFSYEEMKSLKNKAVDSVKSKIESDSDWKGIIGASN
ncbi:MAG: hypothetical protein ACD_5C00006G0004 [uncultured bacterium]|nr:MAG: hypothetical protein ACD_5C00006G0004 [uncultured bacterium]